ncbi:MAG: hypothetical protein DRQ56_05585 [Gammaproteobacteria bacterium]|nr:MAG: hypothetical protein DRQ56_05585 [Gammaproteobacteria bacterium]
MDFFMLRLRQYLRESDLARVNCEVVADHFAVSLSTLRRRCVNNGSTWSNEYQRAQQIRFDVLWHDRPGGCALEYFYQCGYREVNSFYRAFRVWHGCSFGGFRRRFLEAA